MLDDDSTSAQTAAQPTGVDVSTTPVAVNPSENDMSVSTGTLSGSEHNSPAVVSITAEFSDRVDASIRNTEERYATMTSLMEDLRQIFSDRHHEPGLENVQAT